MQPVCLRQSWPMLAAVVFFSVSFHSQKNPSWNDRLYSRPGQKCPRDSESCTMAGG